MAEILSERGFKIVATSDSKGGVYSETGLDIKRLKDWKIKNGTVGDFEGGKNISNEELLELKVDILIPAALESVITEKNAPEVKAKTIVELANGPTTPEADEILNKKGVIIVPDVLANAGGVTVSCFEWEQNKVGEHWGEVEVQKKLGTAMLRAFGDIWSASEQYKVPLRKAAFVKAIERIVEKMG